MSHRDRREKVTYAGILTGAETDALTTTVDTFCIFLASIGGKVDALGSLGRGDFLGDGACGLLFAWSRVFKQNVGRLQACHRILNAKIWQYLHLKSLAEVAQVVLHRRWVSGATCLVCGRFV